jgi:hypothetical protein
MPPATSVWTPTGVPFRTPSIAPTLSGDGRYLAYASTAPLTEAGDEGYEAESTSGRAAPPVTGCT